MNKIIFNTLMFLYMWWSFQCYYMIYIAYTTDDLI